jgi:hypothetical protein
MTSVESPVSLGPYSEGSLPTKSHGDGHSTSTYQ